MKTTNILLTVSYDGTDFFGYQVQPNKRTVQSELENAILKLTGESVKTVITAVGTVKATVGAIGAVTVFSIILPPIIYTVLYKLSLFS